MWRIRDEEAGDEAAIHAVHAFIAQATSPRGTDGGLGRVRNGREFADL